MPEGDAVWRTARRLHLTFAGKILQGSDFRVPALATTDLFGRRTIEVVPRGKHLLHRIEGGLTLHSHLRMDGSWRIRPVESRHAAARRHSTRALLWTAHEVAVGDLLGMLDLLPTQDEERVVGHLGPDLLDPEFSLTEAVSKISADSRTIGSAMLDQRNVAGLGTIFVAEPLHHHRVHPWSPAAQIPQDVIGQILRTAQRLLVDSCRTGRPPQQGAFGRRAHACDRCGHLIRTALIGTPPQERLLHYCPGCQGGLAPGDDGKPQVPWGHPGRYLL